MVRRIRYHRIRTLTLGPNLEVRVLSLNHAIPSRKHHSARRVRRALMQLLGVDLNIHHTRYPKQAYRDNRVAHEFRNLHCQRILAPIDDHKELHSTTPPPAFPSREEMNAQISRCRNNGCSKEGCTQPIKLALREVPVGIQLPNEVVVIGSLT